MVEPIQLDQFDSESKKQLYADFDIAVKFVVSEGTRFARDDHYALFWASATELGWGVDQLRDEVEHARHTYRVKTGCVLEVPERGSKGQTIGFKCLALEFETGPEFWLCVNDLLQLGPDVLTHTLATLSASAGTNAPPTTPDLTSQAASFAKDVAGEVAKEVAKEAVIAGVSSVVTAIFIWAARCWPKGALTRMGHVCPAIEFVEVRTIKGVRRVKFDDFHPGMITCVAMKLKAIEHLAALDDGCFDGKAFDPPPRR